MFKVNTSDAPETDLKCRRCNATLCSLKGGHLYVSDGVIVVSAVLRCVACGYHKKYAQQVRNTVDDANPPA